MLASSSIPSTGVEEECTCGCIQIKMKTLILLMFSRNSTVNIIGIMWQVGLAVTSVNQSYSYGHCEFPMSCLLFVALDALRTSFSLNYVQCIIGSADFVLTASPCHPRTLPVGYMRHLPGKERLRQRKMSLYELISVCVRHENCISRHLLPARSFFVFNYA